MARSMARWTLVGCIALAVLGAAAVLDVGSATAVAAADVSSFAGSWSGTWIGLDNGADGTLSWTVSDAGRLTGTITHTQVGDTGAICGDIRADGFVRMVAFVPSDDPALNGCGAPLDGPAEIDGDGNLVIALTQTANRLRFVVILERN